MNDYISVVRAKRVRLGHQPRLQKYTYFEHTKLVVSVKVVYITVTHSSSEFRSTHGEIMGTTNLYPVPILGYSNSMGLRVEIRENSE